MSRILPAHGGYRDFYSYQKAVIVFEACFCHPKVDGVVTRGFWAGAQSRPESSFWNKDWTLTPMGKQWVELTGKGTTDEELKTNQDGQVRLRGYCGDYTITAGKVARKLRLGNKGISIKLHVP